MTKAFGAGWDSQMEKVDQGREGSQSISCDWQEDARKAAEAGDDGRGAGTLEKRSSGI